MMPANKPTRPAKAPVIAIVGCTGAVGREMLDVLAQRRFAFSELRCLASTRSAGQILEHALGRFAIAEATAETLMGVDIALFSAGSAISKQLAPAAAASGCIVVDNSSAFRMDAGVPLVVPEVNPGHIPASMRVRQGGKAGGIIANPNCSTIIMLMAVTPLHRAFGVKRMVVSTYQAASGAGAMAMDELRNQTGDVLAGRPAEPKIFREPYAFNLFCHNASVDEATGYNVEEQKMLSEAHKIWGDDSVRISAMCVRVPVLRAHCESINLTLAMPVSEAQVRRVLQTAPGVQIVDDRALNAFPTPLKVSGKDDVLVGRIRLDRSQLEHPLAAPRAGELGVGVELFIAGDQLLKGAALNAVQIAELIL